MSNYEKFREVYVEKLTAAVLRHPELYAWDVSTVEEVADKMMDAIKRDSYASSETINATAKKLGLKTTRRAIVEFVNG